MFGSALGVRFVRPGNRGGLIVLRFAVLPWLAVCSAMMPLNHPTVPRVGGRNSELVLLFANYRVSDHDDRPRKLTLPRS